MTEFDMQPLATLEPQKRRGGPFHDIIVLLGIVLAALVIAFSLTRFVFQSYEVDGPSMETTLNNRDRLIVWKVPRTLAGITGNSYSPSRGEIVVFKERNLPQMGTTSGEKQLIKRVIGVPGDRVVIADGSVTIYNGDNPNGFNPDKGVVWSDAIVTTTGNVDITVEPDAVFVMGDNRSNSADSRVFGTVPAIDLVGELALRIYPLTNAQTF